MTPENAKLVADVLEYLQQWHPDISDGEIRRGSAVLRRLLVEMPTDRPGGPSATRNNPRSSQLIFLQL